MDTRSYNRGSRTVAWVHHTSDGDYILQCPEGVYRLRGGVDVEPVRTAFVRNGKCYVRIDGNRQSMADWLIEIAARPIETPTAAEYIPEPLEDEPSPEPCLQPLDHTESTTPTAMAS